MIPFTPLRTQNKQRLKLLDGEPWYCRDCYAAGRVRRRTTGAADQQIGKEFTLRVSAAQAAENERPADVFELETAAKGVRSLGPRKLVRQLDLSRRRVRRVQSAADVECSRYVQDGGCV